MARRRRKQRARGFFIIVVIVLIVAGFLTRRLMMPRATHYMTYRTPDSSEPANSGNRSAADNARASRPAAPAEHLTDSDRRALDEVIKRKTGGQ
jgi:hypothetical protein